MARINDRLYPIFPKANARTAGFLRDGSICSARSNCSASMQSLDAVTSRRIRLPSSMFLERADARISRAKSRSYFAIASSSMDATLFRTVAARKEGSLCGFGQLVGENQLSGPGDQMPCYVLRDGHIAAVELLTDASDDSAIAQAEALLDEHKGKFAASKSGTPTRMLAGIPKSHPEITYSDLCA